MKTLRWIALAAGGIAASAVAADFDGSKPLLCATVEAADCVPGMPCHHGHPADVGARLPVITIPVR